MFTWWNHKAYKPFFLTGIATTLLAIAYLTFFPNSEFDLSIYNYFVVSSYVLWLVFSAYLFLLASVYYVASRTKLRTRKWLVISHYVFILLFLLTLFTFSLFNLTFTQSLLSSMPFSLLISIYGTLFLVDIVFFFISIILLLVNLVGLRKE